MAGRHYVGLLYHVPCWLTRLQKCSFHLWCHQYRWGIGCHQYSSLVLQYCFWFHRWPQVHRIHHVSRSCLPSLAVLLLPCSTTCPSWIWFLSALWTWCSWRLPPWMLCSLEGACYMPSAFPQVDTGCLSFFDLNHHHHHNLSNALCPLNMSYNLSSLGCLARRQKGHNLFSDFVNQPWQGEIIYFITLTSRGTHNLNNHTDWTQQYI